MSGADTSRGHAASQQQTGGGAVAGGQTSRACPAYLAGAWAEALSSPGLDFGS